MKPLAEDQNLKVSSLAMKGLGLAFFLGHVPLLLLSQGTFLFKAIFVFGSLGILGIGCLLGRSTKVPKEPGLNWLELKWERVDLKWQSKIIEMGIFLAALLALANQAFMNSIGQVGSGFFWSALVLIYLVFFRKQKVLYIFMVLHAVVYFLSSSSEIVSGEVSSDMVLIVRWIGFLVCATWSVLFLSIALIQKDIVKREQEGLQKKNQEEMTQGFLRSLSGGIAHEINNPLQIINGSASKISRLHFASSEDQASVRLLQHKLISASQIIGLFVRSIHAPSSTFIKKEKADFLVIQPIEKVLIELGLIGDSTIEGSSHTEVHTHLDILEQILRSLCQNAKEAAREGQRPVVKLSYKISERGLEIRVADYGIGINEHDLENIFDPFFTTKDYSLHLGLGLSNSRSAAFDLGGSLDVLPGSFPTVFRLVIPQEKWNI